MRPETFSVLSYSFFDRQGARPPPDIVHGVDGIHHSEISFKIILVFAEFKRQMTSERVTAVMLSRASNGQWNGGKVPYGCVRDKENHTFDIVGHEAKVIQKMAELYEQYQSLLYVAKYMNDAGVPTKTGKAETFLLHIPTTAWYNDFTENPARISIAYTPSCCQYGERRRRYYTNIRQNMQGAQ